jgi:hypothetical protein
MSASDPSPTDPDLAGRHQAALQRLIDEHTAGGTDPRRLRRALALCRELAASLDDEYCRRKVLVVEECAAELFSTAEPRARGNLSGVDFLRGRIREALELVQSRLYSLERARRFGHPVPARGLAARFAG